MKKDYLFVCPGEKEKWKAYSAYCDIIELEGKDSGTGFLIPREYIDINVEEISSLDIKPQWRAVEDAFQLGYEYHNEIVAITP